MIHEEIVVRYANKRHSRMTSDLAIWWPPRSHIWCPSFMSQEFEKYRLLRYFPCYIEITWGTNILRQMRNGKFLSVIFWNINLLPSKTIKPFFGSCDPIRIDPKFMSPHQNIQIDLESISELKISCWTTADLSPVKTNTSPLNIIS